MRVRAEWWSRRFAICSALLASLLAAAPTSEPAAAQTAAQAPAFGAVKKPGTPGALFGDLFLAVQNAKIFPDSKTFADAVPKASPAQILASYHESKPATPEALKRFVELNFEIPSSAAPAPAAAAQGGPRDITVHIDSLWNQLTRSTDKPPPYSSLLATPQPYVVPGGRFRELYYWDSYFTMLGLAESGRQDLLEPMVADFAYLIDTYGHVPNGTRSYYVSRSQPPFFYAMVRLLSPDDPAGSYVRYLPELRREHAFWMEGEAGLAHRSAHRRVVALPDGAILNRYFDDADTPREESFREDTELARRSGRIPKQVYRDLRAAAESGWDFGSRWFADGKRLETIDTTQIIPVDLNSLLYGLEEAIAAGCVRAGDSGCAGDFSRRAAERRDALNRVAWDAAAGVYRDYRWTRSSRVMRISAAMLYPLFTGLASAPQAEAVARAVQHELLKPGGIATTPLETGQQWDAPNGWAPLQWIGVSGLRRYGISSLAEAAACRWMSIVNRVYRDTGKLVEKYDVIATGRPGGGGEYPTQDGFGWTNGVQRKLMALYPADAARDAPEQCPAPATVEKSPGESH